MTESTAQATRDVKKPRPSELKSSEWTKGLAEAPSEYVHRDARNVPLQHQTPRREMALSSLPRLTRAQVELLLRAKSLETECAPDRARRIGLRLHSVGNVDLIRPRVELLPRGLRDRAAKRAVDVTFGTFALLLAAPIMIVIAFALWVEDRQIFFVQSRVGRRWSRFDCLKFRSMRRDADRLLQDILRRDACARIEWARHQKLSRDPRVTPLGQFLRKTSLDELPQLFNVLKGDMSLVGPRPIIAPEVPGYDSDRSYFESSAFNDYAGCLPGITGLWQVSGRHRTSHDERVRLDQWYARNWSFWLDLGILVRTVRVVLTRSGA